MSLLEDIFLQDEADEAQQLERVIEGDEYDERPRDLSEAEEDENVIGEDEAEEDKRRVDPTTTKTKKVTKNPRVILNPARLTGPRGIQVIPDHFKDFKFKGKEHEKEDLDIVLKKLEHWAYRLYPKFQFEDCLKKIETLGKKRPVMVHLHKIRTDQFMSEETVEQKDSSDEETQVPQEEDEFDKLLQQQIELARSTPAPGSVKKLMETPKTYHKSPLMMPKATSSPSISDEQKERMIRNRKLAEERRLARLNNTDNKLVNNNITEENETIIIPDNVTTKNQQETNRPIDSIDLSNIENGLFTNKKNNKSNIIHSSDDETNSNTKDQETIIIDDNAEKITGKKRTSKEATETIDLSEAIDTENITTKKNRSNVIDSDTSDDDCNVTTVNESISADVHVDKHIENNIIDKEIIENDIEPVANVDNAMSVHEIGDDLETNETNNELGVVDKSNENNITSNYVRNDNDTETANDVNSITEKEDSLNNEAEIELKKGLEQTNDDSKTNTVDVSNKDTNLQEKAVDEFAEEIMDVDFSDDF